MVKVLNMRWVLGLSVSVCAAMPVRAVNPSYRISQYGHTAWRIQDGYLGGAPNTIAQTVDGYLWVGTEAGLLRFDGVRFVPWTPPAGKQLLSSNVTALLAARDGSLWIGTELGLSHWTNQDLINYSSYANARVNSIIEDDDGSVWIVRTRVRDGTGSLCQVKGTAMRCYGKADGLPDPGYDTLVRDPGGNLWLGGNTSLTRWKPGSFNTYYPSGLKSNAGMGGISALVVRPDDSLWVGMVIDGPGLGLQQFLRGVWKPFVTPELDSSTVGLNTLFLDRQGTLWIGTASEGIYRIHGDEVDRFRNSDGLSSDNVFRFFEDKEGNLWVATSKGIDSFRDLKITTYSTREGITTIEVDSVFALRDGTVWVGGSYALVSLAQGRMSALQTRKGLPGNQVTSLYEDDAGRQWVGIDNTLYLYEEGKFTRINRQDGRPMGMVGGIAEDATKNMWVLIFGRPQALIRMHNGKVQEELQPPPMPRLISTLAPDPIGGIWFGLVNGDLARYQRGRTEIFRFDHTSDSQVNQLLVNSDGSVLGATAFGLIGWSNGKQQTLSARNGLPCDSVYALVEDAAGAVWLYLQCGLVEIEKSELQRWWAQANVKVQLKVFDVLDGFRPGWAPFQKAARSLDGRLWFANGDILQALNPAALPRNPIPPPVHVEQVIADRRSYSPLGDIGLPPRTRDLEIDYTAVSFSIPQKVRFRYKLEGHDAAWQEPGTRRQAFYSDLPPGPYRFQVIACNNDGVWNNDGATLSFNIAAAWYQTNWFRVAGVAAVLLLLWAIYQLRLRQIAGQFNIRLEVRVGERTRIARELHDTLLQNLHGLMFQFQSAINMLPQRPGDAKQTLEEAVADTEQAITESQNAIEDLRSEPVGQRDLAELVTAAGNELRDSQDTDGNSPGFDVIVEGERRPLAPVIQDEVYRIAREVLRNAFRHAAAHKIEAEIRFDAPEFRLRIRDDGKGIAPRVLEEGKRAGHWGLPGVRERAQRIGAKLDLWSETGAGTEVQLTLPAALAYERSRDRFGFRVFRRAPRHEQRS